MSENIFKGIIEDAKWLVASRLMKQYGIFFDGVRDGNRADLTITTRTAVVELAGMREPKSNDMMNGNRTNIFTGAIDDGTWDMMIRFMEKYGVYFNGVRNGNKIELAISTPKDTFRLAGRITPKTDSKSRMSAILSGIIKN